MRSPHARPSAGSLGALGVVTLCFLFGLLIGFTVSAWQWRGLARSLQAELESATQELAEAQRFLMAEPQPCRRRLDLVRAR